MMHLAIINTLDADAAAAAALLMSMKRHAFDNCLPLSPDTFLIDAVKRIDGFGRRKMYPKKKKEEEILWPAATKNNC